MQRSGKPTAAWILWLAGAICLSACDPGLKLRSDPASHARPAAAIQRIAFGSCNDAFAEQPLWPRIAALKPDVFLWTGDIVYADVATIPPVRSGRRWRFPLPRVATVQDLRAHYAVQKRIPAYAALRTNTRVIGIYDDHDYGKNNGGREFPLREAARDALLDFLDVAPDHPRRTRSGAFAVHDFPTPAGKLRIILLDTRFHREAPGPKADVLGAAQWLWLRDRLKNSPARFHWLVSSIQVIPEDHSYEAWARFPAARQRLFALLNETRPAGLVLISGDRHLAEISSTRTDGGLRLLEITASGMTHSVPPDWREPNRHRTGALHAGLNFGMARFESSGRMHLEIRDERGRPVLVTVLTAGPDASAK
ncbi:MAG: alkaline phosphatase family protein [bacterium]|nr:alkaline phosphatase family protein [bacterium]